MPLTNVCAMFLWCLFGANAVPSGHCMEQEENGLVQLVSLQPNVESSQYHRRARRFRRFGRFGRYGGKTTSTSRAVTTTESTTQETTTSTESTTQITTEGTTATTSTTTTTRVVCTGGNFGDAVRLFEPSSPPKNTFTFDVSVTSPECECVGGPAFGSIPGYLRVLLGTVEDPNGVSFISITSPNDTDVKVAPVRTGGVLTAITVAFNGFPAIGSWVIKLLDASGNLSTQTSNGFAIDFGLISCNQVLPTPACVGNTNRGTTWLAQNLSLVGTTLSPSPTIIQFDVGANSACCVPPGSLVQLSLEFTPNPSGTLNAAGLSPDAIAFDLTGNFQFFNFAPPLTPLTLVVAARVNASEGVGRAAGLWTLNTSTDSATAVINSTFEAPGLLLAVEPCA